MKKFKKILNNISGLTMVELIIALAISLVIVAAAGYIFLSQSGAMRASKSVSTEQQRLNNAFSAVEYNLKMAGFDNASYYFRQLALMPSAPAGSIYILPVMINNANYAAPAQQPYEVLVSYFSPTSLSSCVITAPGKKAQAAGNFKATPACFTSSLVRGVLLVVFNPGSPPSAGTTPTTFCVTNVVPASGTIGVEPGVGNPVCPNPPDPSNPIPPNSISGGAAMTLNLKQVLFYWGNQSYGTQNSGFNPPFNQPGVLYECAASPSLTESNPPAPTCQTNTTIQLDSNVNNFSVMPLAGYINAVTLQPYVYLLTISAESGAAVTPSPAYSVNTGYNPNITGGNPQQNRSTIPGYNIVKTLNANILLRNVEYGS